MPGDLWTGYLQAQAADVAETEREEEKKRQRLQDQLQKLNMESLSRTIERDARDYEREEAGRAQKEEMLSKLEGFLSPEEMAVFRLGGDLSDWREFTEERYTPTPDELMGEWRIEAGLEPKAGGGSTRSLTDREAVKRIFEKPKGEWTEFERKSVKKYFEGTRGATKPISPSGTGITELDEVLMESGATFDPASGAFIHVPEGLDKLTLPGQGTGLDALNMGAIGQETGLEGLNIRGIGSQPAGTVTEEDEFIEEARGKKIDWDLVAKDHPDWNIFYIKQKLGVNE